jgi:hypothetical protein
MPIPPSKLAATTSATKFLSSRHETALCCYLTDSLPLHSYCMQTLRHGKLQNALAGSMLRSSGPRLASRRPWWALRVDHSSSERARPSHIGVLEVSVSHHENRPIALTFLLVSLLNVIGLTPSAPQTPVQRPVRAEAASMVPIAPSRFSVVASATTFPNLLPRNALCTSVTDMPHFEPHCMQTFHIANFKVL